MNFYKHWPWWKSMFGVRPDAKTLMVSEVEELRLELLQRELMLIDDQYRIAAKKAKIAFIENWLK